MGHIYSLFLLIIVFCSLPFAYGSENEKGKGNNPSCKSVASKANSENKQPLKALNKEEAELEFARSLIVELDAEEALLRTTSSQLFEEQFSNSYHTQPQPLLMFGNPKFLALNIFKLLFDHSKELSKPNVSVYIEVIGESFISSFIAFHDEFVSKHLNSSEAQELLLKDFLSEFENFYLREDEMYDANENSEKYFDGLEASILSLTTEELFVHKYLPMILQELEKVLVKN